MKNETKKYPIFYCKENNHKESLLGKISYEKKGSKRKSAKQRIPVIEK